MLDWEKLLSSQRRKPSLAEGSSVTGSGRQEIERDYDRILFATPTRRLADKTQVFPLDKNDSVRTRLTHSHEVSNLARSIGIRLAFEHAEKVFGSKHLDLKVQRIVPSLLAAIGLAHDLGNPPFGHQGEEAIRQWFKETAKSAPAESIHADFLNFDGNAQTLRLLTRLQILNDSYGLNLTYATLSALMKYPSFHDSGDKNKRKKWGIFESERKIATEIMDKVGLDEGNRHPLAYIMEACDDIAYSVLDAEDTVKKGYASFYDLMDYLKHHSDNDEIVERVVSQSETKNKEFRKEVLSSRELNDVSMQMFRVYAIYQLIVESTASFLDNINEIMSGQISGDFELIKSSKADTLCRVLKSFDRRYGFMNRDVLALELQGSNYIKSLMDMLWEAISGEAGNSTFNSYAYQRISENYRRVYEGSERKVYDKYQLLCDAISGMTDSYAIAFHDELRPLHRGFRNKG